MAVKPILFNTEMVQAIWAGRKTVTRRLANRTNNRGMILKPFEVGDVLWVRETWALRPCIECLYDEDCERDKPDVLETKDAITEGCWLYRADGENPYYDPDRIRWSPSIHMPPAAARIFLRVTEITCENLRDITDAEARAEGLGNRCEFVNLWITTTPKGRLGRDGWAANPRVWVIRFERCERPAGWPG